MKIQEIAEGLVKFCKKGRWSEATAAYYSNKIVSIEPAGPEKEIKGLEAVNERSKWWVENHTIHKLTVEGPYVGRNQFVVRFICDVTFKAKKERFTLDELALYNVRAGKIVRAQFFYHAG